jgi:hypothetical protein
VTDNLLSVQPAGKHHGCENSTEFVDLQGISRRNIKRANEGHTISEHDANKSRCANEDYQATERGANKSARQRGLCGHRARCEYSTHPKLRADEYHLATERNAIRARRANEDFGATERGANKARIQTNVRQRRLCGHQIRWK